MDLGYGAEAWANFAVNVPNGLVLALVAVLALETSDSGVSDTSSTLVVGDGATGGLPGGRHGAGSHRRRGRFGELVEPVLLRSTALCPVALLIRSGP